MQCANCQKDFKDVDGLKGYYTLQNPHFGRPFRQFGMVCPHCAFHNTIFYIPVKVPFVRTGRTYPKLDKIIEDFQNQVEEYYKERKRLNPQHSLFEEEHDNLPKQN